MKISYKLVIDQDGVITEEAFENNELMVERAKVLVIASLPVEPAVEPEKKIKPIVPVEPVA